MNFNKVRPIILSTSVAMLLASCTGGGGGSGDTSSNATSSTSSESSTTTSLITGTVPGTLIEAFCTDGSYYKTNSTDNGTTQHPFSITIPKNIDCRLVMTTNEDNPVNRVITPIKLSAGNKVSGLINTETDFDLGYVPLSLDPSNIIDINNDNVVDTPLIVSVTLPDGVILREVSFDLLDDDGDDIPNIYEDDDNDGEFNKEDDDDDGDGIADIDEVDHNDSDHDGIEDDYDKDDDNDGIEDSSDSDDDGNGISDDDDENLSDSDSDENNAEKSDDDSSGNDSSDNTEETNDDSENDNGLENNNNTSTTASITLPNGYEVTRGRLLASQCAQCHGTNGQSVNGWEDLAGESASEIIEEMREMQAGDEDPIMQAQAHGYSDEEIQALASWFASQNSDDNAKEDETESEDEEDEEDE